jgi:hypothetical protein
MLMGGFPGEQKIQDFEPFCRFVPHEVLDCGGGA